MDILTALDVAAFLLVLLGVAIVYAIRVITRRGALIEYLEMKLAEVTAARDFYKTARYLRDDRGRFRKQTKPETN